VNFSNYYRANLNLKEGEMTRKRLLALSGAILIAVILAVMPLMAGCAEPAPPAEAKTLKIGCLVDFGFPIGMDTKKELEAVVPVINEKGGLVIGGERYNIDLIIYDSKMSAETCLLYTSPSPRDATLSRMPSSA